MKREVGIVRALLLWLLFSGGEQLVWASDISQPTVFPQALSQSRLYGELFLAFVVLPLLIFLFFHLFRQRYSRREKRKQIEHHLQLAVARTLLETSPFGIFIAVDGIVRYANKGCQALMRVSAGRPCVIGYADPKQWEKLETLLETTERLSNVEIDSIDASGKSHSLLITYAKTIYEGQQGVIAWLVDVTSLQNAQAVLVKAKEMAETASQVKSDFLANMSHEIRTPMNGIIGLTHLALQTPLTEKQRDYLKKIETSARNLLRIVNDILDFSKIEAGRMEMEQVAFNLEDVFNNVASVVAEDAGKKGLELVFRLPSSVPVYLRGDPLRLTQVLMNLCSNAVKFTPTGEIVIYAHVLERSDCQVTLSFVVSDTGIGIASHRIEYLFNAFAQASTSTTREYGGTGLGLAICKQLVRLMGGEISVRSTLGRGSQFGFRALFECLPDSAPLPRFGKELIALCVDGNASTRAAIAEMLKGMRIRCLTAVNGKEAVSLLRDTGEKTPDILFVDWNLGEQNGEKTNRFLKKAYPNILAVLLATLHDREEAQELAENDFARAVLVKPVLPSTLRALVEALDGEKDGSSHSWQSPPKPEQGPLLAGNRILLAEDNEINQQIIQELLASQGIDVDIAANGLEALEKARKETYDAILMDVQMPIMDGLTAVRLLRNESRLAHIPVIALTASAMSGDREKCLEAGMQEHISKPVDPEQLFTVLRRWLTKDISSSLTTEN